MMLGMGGQSAVGPTSHRPTNAPSFLESAFNIRPSEGPTVALMFFYVMGVVATFIIGRTVRDTLFLNRVSVDALPLMYVSIAAAVAFASWLYSHIADKYRRDRLIKTSLLVFVAISAVFWVLIRLRVGAWVYPGLYVAVEVVGAISIMQFWTFANDIFSGRQAKRLFAIIGAGGVLANIIVGFVIGGVASFIASEDLLLVSATIFMGCWILVRRVAGRAQADLEIAVRRPKRAKLQIGTEGERVLHSKHLQIIAGIVVLTFLTTTIVDYQFKVFVKTHYPEEAQLTAYFGYFYAFTGIISSAMQFFITGRVIERFGIVVALAILPVALATGVLGILLVPIVSTVVAVTVAKGAENIFRYTVNDATMQLLYVPVPSHRRGRAKAFIDGILKQGSIAASGLLLFGLGRMATAEELAFQLAYVDIAFLVIWLGLIMGIRREYVRSLLETLRARRLDLGDRWSPIVDEGTHRLLQGRLQSEDEQEVLTTLEILTSVDADFHGDLLHLLDHPSEAIRIRALTLIGDSGRLDGAQQIHDLCRDPSPSVRSAAITAFCAVGRERAVHAVRTFLSDSDGRVRAAAVAAMIQHGGLDGILTAAETLKAFLESPEPQDRLHGAQVLRDIKVKNFFQPVLTLLQDSDPEVRLAAVEAAGEMLSPELVVALIYKLADPATAMAAVRALIAHGASIERTLFKVLRNAQEDIRIRRRIPRVLERVGGQEAFEVLIATLDTKDIELRTNVARAAARIRERIPHLKIDEQALNRVIRAQMKTAYQVLNVLLDLGLPADHLLAEALTARHRRHLALAFRLFEIRYPARTIQLVHANLDSENRAIRANALEVVDNVLHKDEARWLLPLLEDIGLEQKVDKGRECFSTERRTAAQWLDRLVVDSDPWMITCTLHHVAEHRMGRFIPRLRQHLSATDPLVRETAVVSLRRLLEADVQLASWTEALLEQAQSLTQDSVPEVQRAAIQLVASLRPA